MFIDGLERPKDTRSGSKDCGSEACLLRGHHGGGGIVRDSVISRRSPDVVGPEAVSMEAYKFGEDGKEKKVFRLGIYSFIFIIYY